MRAKMGISGHRRPLILAAVLLACLGTARTQPQKTDAAIPPNSTIVFGGSVSDFGTLTLNDGSVIAFAPSLLNVTITCDHLIVNGKAEIDLTRREALPEAPVKPGTPTQAGNDNAPQNGQNGNSGQAGTKGANGINLVFKAGSADVSNGALWINTDGGQGGSGGPGGDGAKGSSGPSTCTHNANGGNGGAGGAGGIGGAGGDTGAIWFSVGGVPPLVPHPTNGVSPTPRPPEANLNGAIVIAGNPGPGGSGGPGGNGGPGGEGHGKSGGVFCTDTGSSSGSGGPHGANGPNGPPGNFTRTPPPNLSIH
jgi:hypothetical protein